MRSAMFDSANGESVKWTTIDRLRRTHSLGRQAIYDALKRGDITGYKLGTRTLLNLEQVEGWLASLPKWTPETV